MEHVAALNLPEELWLNRLERARNRMDGLAKPPGSLGFVETFAVQVAAIQGVEKPVLEQAGLAVFAADHGVCVHGVSLYPSQVTRAMVGQFLGGKAAVTCLARRSEVRVLVVDAGVGGESFPEAPGFLDRKVRPGSGDLSSEGAMSLVEAGRALDAGREAARVLSASGSQLLMAGDMGIGNTTAAAALACAFLGLDPLVATGRGTGLDEAARIRKADVVQRGLQAARDALGSLDQADPLEVAARLGGLEIVAIAGFLLQGAQIGLPLLLDGFPVTSGALLAWRLQPAVVRHFLAGHVSAEPAHGLCLEAMGLHPVLDLGMRLGEGTGAVLAWPVVRAACDALSDMATLAEVLGDRP